MAPAPHHGEVDAGVAALNLHGQNVHVLVVHGVHRLLVQDLGKRRDLVAQLCRLLELELVGVRQHALLQVGHDLLGFSPQKPCGAGHIVGIVLHRDVADTGPRAALDLKQQARARAMAEHRVFTSAQVKNFLHQPNGFAHRPYAGVRPKIIMPLVDRAAVIDHPWAVCGMGRSVCGSGTGGSGPGELQVGVTFVVPKQDVVLGLERLDEVVFQEQSLGLRTHHRGFHAGDLAHHVANAGAAMLALKITGHPLAQIDGLAHVQHLVFRIEIAVHPRQSRQCGHLGQQSFRKDV